MIWIMERCKLVVEGAAAAPVAALLHGLITLPPGSRVACVLSGGNLNLDQLRTLNDWATDSLRPDLTLVFDLPEEEGLTRARSRNAWLRYGHIQFPLHRTTSTAARSGACARSLLRRGD